MKRIIVTLCGSGRFKEAFEDANMAETLAGRAVFTIGMVKFTHMPQETKDGLDALHLDKIEMSDEILVIDEDVDGKPYIGESTRKEIEHAQKLGKKIRYTSKEWI